MRKIVVFLAIILVFLMAIKQAEANCMQLSQEFKCTYKMMKCTNNLDGECECNDGSICKWKDGKPANDNCPCDQPAPRRKRRSAKAGDM